MATLFTITPQLRHDWTELTPAVANQQPTTEAAACADMRPTDGKFSSFFVRFVSPWSLGTPLEKKRTLKTADVPGSMTNSSMNY